MKLTRITGENIKGESFSHELGATTAIVGTNFSGKSAILEAIRLALIGFIPEIGKRSSSTWELSSGSKMSVQVRFDDVRPLTREFWLEGGTVKSQLRVGDEALPFGSTDFESLPLLSPEAYFELTDSEGTQYKYLNESDCRTVIARPGSLPRSSG